MVAGSRRDVVRADEGVASVVAAGLVALLALTGVAGIALGQFALARQRVAAAADLAALAAATRLLRGGTDDDVCARAAAVASPAGAQVVRCEVSGTEVAVRLSAPAPPLLARFVAWAEPGAAAVQAESRAGLPAAGPGP